MLVFLCIFLFLLYKNFYIYYVFQHIRNIAWIMFDKCNIIINKFIYHLLDLRINPLHHLQIVILCLIQLRV